MMPAKGVHRSAPRGGGPSEQPPSYGWPAPMSLIDRVRQFIRDHDLMRAATRVVAAVSGGSDSVALASLLRELHARGEIRLVGIAHFNHQLRPTAGRDERH